MKKTRLEDRGIYTCSFPIQSSDKTFRIELVVGAAPKPYVKMLKTKGLLECEVPGAYPKPTVEWWDSDNKTLHSKTLEDREDQDRFYIIIQTSVTKPDCYRCVATQMEIRHRISSETCVSEVPGLPAALIGVICFIVGALAVVAVLVVRRYCSRRTENGRLDVV
ncbi:erythroid membrane-associated protein-like [Neolamprologus brichardi]|uniref:erythroid membrane-associated protein-like n=1 Tax=Neolamprologus brichardi TaxID=32507 RepID=UPI0016438026|nr:erythroid membrane-associated protein-like [Neolamprologus brichardi]